jgi:3-oxoacyl-[acyl-carrier-protein] synthase-3
VVEPEQASSDIAAPAAAEALERAGVRPQDVDLVIVATATPDMLFPATASLVGEAIGAVNAAAFDLSAGCTGFIYALAQAYGAVSSGLAGRALVIGSETLSKVMNWSDRTTCILFGDGAAAVVVEKVADGGFLGFELGSDGSGAADLCLPAGGSRAPATSATVEQDLHTLRMNGREVFRFATRAMVASAEAVLEACERSAADVDLYAPHQANLRIIDHAVRHLGIAPEKVLLNVDRFGNTSSASIPLALHEALQGGALAPGMTVLMTAVGAGLTWGSSLVVWSNGK